MQTKKERRQLKKEQKQLRRERAVRNKWLMKWGFILGASILLGGSFFLFRYVRAKRYENAPKIQLTPITYDFGEIFASQGIVDTSFKVNNVGVSTLVISGLETSCGCTKARLKVKDQDSNIVESPEFGMHGNPTDWSANLEPGEEAELVVTFDPNFHKNTFGPVTRTVSIFSNDPWQSTKATIYANVK